jgi:predicted DNA-binding transcriptional regulator AlpA
VSEVADRTGLALNTVKAYSQDTPRLMPKPDAMIGRVKGWTAQTIDAWHAGKSGNQPQPRPSAVRPQQG